MKPKTDNEELFTLITEKSSLKNEIYNHTLHSFNLIKDVITKLSNEFSKYKDNNEIDSSTIFLLIRLNTQLTSIFLLLITIW